MTYAQKRDDKLIKTGLQASKVDNSLIIKINTGTTEGTSKYTFDGSTSKSLDIKAGSNVTLSTNQGEVTISASNAITGVKGNSESSYRTGNVNLTAANIGAAASSHNHDASDITSGTIDIARLPAAALERLVTVTDATARKALTTSSVQVGDTVKETSTGKMYRVVDDSKLSSDDGYVEYSVGSAASVPWSGITGKPSSYTPSSHTHGNITNAGAIGSTASLPIITGTNGVLQTGSFGNSAGTFCQGDDARLSNTRNTTNSLVLKLKSGSTEGTDLYTFNGSAAKTLDIKQGSNITLTAAAGSLTIAAKDTTYTFTNKAATLAWGSTSTIATVGGTDITVTMPANPNTNTDTLMTQNVSTGNATYPILLCPTANATANQGAKTGIFGSGVKVNPSTSEVIATKFTGALTGNVTGNCSGSSGSCTGNAATVTGTAGTSTLAWNSEVTLYTVGGHAIKAKLPANPNSDTHWTSHLYAGGSGATANAATSNGGTYLSICDNSTSRNSIKITGSGATTVTSDANGVITINSTDTNTDTNTHYTTTAYVGASNTKANAATSNGGTYLKLYDDNTRRAEFKITGSGATTVTSDTNGNITISSTDNNTDTHYTSHLYAGASNGNANAATTNGNTYLILCDNTTARDRRLIKGTGATTVTSDASGNIIINSTDTNTQTITGVKGNSESSYRTGNVNLTAANIGAAASSHTHSYLPLSGGTLSGALNTSEVRSGGNNSELALYGSASDVFGSAIKLHGISDTMDDPGGSSRKGVLEFQGGSANTYSTLLLTSAHFWTNVHIAPELSTNNLGTSNHRWNNAYLTSNPNVSSDSRIKSFIDDIPDTVLDAWENIKWRQFKMNDAIEEKGDDARLHTGLIAQEVNGAFSEKELDPTKYGLYCYDEWGFVEDEEGNIKFDEEHSGNMYSIRYGEALCMEAAYQRRRADKAEARIGALENELSELKLELANLKNIISSL